MKNALLVMVLVTAFASCTTFWKVTDFDKVTKHFPTSEKAVVVLDKPFDLSSRREILVVPSVQENSTYFKEMVSKIGFFKEVISVDELEDEIIHAGVADKVQTVKDRIGFNNAAKYYKPFLFLDFKIRGDGSQKYNQIHLIDALTMEDCFIGEVLWDPARKGVNDQSVWYPLLNSLNDYVTEHIK